MPSVKHYKQAITYLTQVAIDYQSIVVELAKERPDVLLQLVENLKLDTHDIRIERKLQEDVLKAWREGYTDETGYFALPGKISAIKYYRTKTGAGLREAKDYCDELQARLNIQY